MYKRQALRSATDAPDDVTRAADLLASLLADDHDSNSSDPIPIVSPGPVQTLAATFEADPEVSVWLGDTAVSTTAEGTTWERLWLSMLRLPPDLADAWRRRARALPRDNADLPWQEVPGTSEVLVEPGFGVPGLRESSDALPLGAEALPDRFADLRAVAGQVLAMAGHDPALHHALESRRRQDFHSLAEPKNLKDFRRDAANRFSYLADAPVGSVRELRELVLVDELLNSVVHVPPAHPESWWGRLGKRSRAVLTESASALRGGPDVVEVRVIPPGPFDAQRAWVGKHNLSCPVPGRPPSQILACLRVHLRAGGEDHAGRVIYVRDEP